MSRFWSPFVRDLEPYVPGEQPKMARLVKLNTNEHPLGSSATWSPTCPASSRKWRGW